MLSARQRANHEKRACSTHTSRQTDWRRHHEASLQAPRLPSRLLFSRLELRLDEQHQLAVWSQHIAHLAGTEMGAGSANADPWHWRTWDAPGKEAAPEGAPPGAAANRQPARLPPWSRAHPAPSPLPHTSPTPTHRVQHLGGGDEGEVECDDVHGRAADVGQPQAPQVGALHDAHPRVGAHLFRHLQ